MKDSIGRRKSHWTSKIPWLLDILHILKCTGTHKLKLLSNPQDNGWGAHKIINKSYCQIHRTMVGGHRGTSGQEDCKWLGGIGREFFFLVPWVSPKHAINCFLRLIVNALKFSIILIKFFPDCTSRFTMRRNHHWSPNIFPPFSSKHWNMSSVTLSHSVFFFHRRNMEKQINV